jgi:hypothetical protein
LNQKPKLHVLYVDKRQIVLNCFISQLYHVLNECFDLVLVSHSQLTSGKYAKPARGELILSLLKQRMWGNSIPFLARFCERSGLIVYDQDPWESYHDSARCLGSYKLLNDLVPVRQFLVTSGWWSEYIKEKDKLPVSFVRMGVLQSNCSLGAPFAEREHPIGFQGTLHDHRSEFFDFLRQNGKDVAYLPPVEYNKFLTSIQSIGVFIHDERADVRLDGILSYNGIRIKDIEVAARGCFAVRNIDLDKDSYDIDDLPTIFTYSSREEALIVLDRILSIPERRKEDMRRETVARIRKRDDWQTVVRAILQHQ